MSGWEVAPTSGSADAGEGLRGSDSSSIGDTGGVGVPPKDEDDTDAGNVERSGAPLEELIPIASPSSG